MCLAPEQRWGHVRVLFGKRFVALFLLQVWRCQGQTAPGDPVHAAQVDRASCGGEGRGEALRTKSAVPQSSMTGSGRIAIGLQRYGLPYGTWSPGFLQSCNSFGWTSVCVARTQNVTTRRSRELLRVREKRRKRSDTAQPFAVVRREGWQTRS